MSPEDIPTSSLPEPCTTIRDKTGDKHDDAQNQQKRLSGGEKWVGWNRPLDEDGERDEGRADYPERPPSESQPL